MNWILITADHCATNKDKLLLDSRLRKYNFHLAVKFFAEKTFETLIPIFESQLNFKKYSSYIDL